MEHTGGNKMNKNFIISTFLVIKFVISLVGCSSNSDTSEITSSGKTTTLITKNIAGGL